ncbi:MAG: long-chain fatty acid--CoA ligase [Pseudomonadota bacterium]
MTLVDLFGSALKCHADRVALRWKEGEDWKEFSYANLAAAVNAVAKGLVARGTAPGDRICIMSENRPEWIVCDLAALWVGAVTVPIYSTGSMETARFILKHSEARMIFASPLCFKAVAEGKRSSQLLVGFGAGDPTFEELRREGEKVPDAEITARRKAIRPDDVATIIYTSGTTGDPKGVMLTHANIISNIEATTSCVYVGCGDRTLSFLPLSHAFERTAGIFAMLYKGVTISFARDMTTLAEDLLDVRPTFLITVPRMLEKFHARVRGVVARKPRLLRRLFEVALRSGKRNPLFPLYDFVFFRRVRKGFGGCARIVISGGAALAPEIARFFDAVGVPILEGYGLTETSPVVSVNRPGKNKIGTIGPPLPGVEVKIAPDGEILVRGPNVMKGYYKDPQATVEAIDSDGWFATGDIGEIDGGGYLRITDRKKDLIVTSGGKKVAPQPIESELRADPLIQHVCLVGEGRNYIAALIVPNFEVLAYKARGAGIDFSTREELVRHAQVRSWFEEVVTRVNAPRSSFETVKRFELLACDWTVDAGELTPTLKIRRQEIAKRFKRAIEELYFPVASFPEEGNKVGER